MSIDKERLKKVLPRSISLVKKYPYVSATMVLLGATIMAAIWWAS